MYICVSTPLLCFRLGVHLCFAGPDSPTTVTKDVATHTRAVKLKRQSLQDRLELCILELKKLCIREAVSN